MMIAEEARANQDRSRNEELNEEHRRNLHRMQVIRLLTDSLSKTAAAELEDAEEHLGEANAAVQELKSEEEQATRATEMVTQAYFREEEQAQSLRGMLVGMKQKRQQLEASESAARLRRDSLNEELRLETVAVCNQRKALKADESSIRETLQRLQEVKIERASLTRAAEMQLAENVQQRNAIRKAQQVFLFSFFFSLSLSIGPIEIAAKGP